MTDTVKFLHTADLHLDSPLTSLAARDPALASLLQEASRTVLRRLVDTALDNAVDAVLIAGDLFDGHQRDVHTAMVMHRECRRLESAGIPVFIIKGNHDAQARLLDVLNLPSNVHVFDGRGGKLTFANDRAVVHGVSFTKQHMPRSLLSKFGKPEEHCFNIGLLHTSLAGSEGHDVYAPCSVAELVDMGYDYWALGHIHQRCVHHEHPAIVMPGNPLGRHINEAGERSVSLVTLSPDKPARIEPLVIAPFRFDRVRVNLEGIDTHSDAYARILASVKEARSALEIEHLIIRIQLFGTTRLCFALKRDRQSLLIELRTEFEHQDSIWIDSLELDKLRSPVESASRESNHVPGMDAGILRELQALVTNELLGSANLQERATKDLEKLVRALPADVRDHFGDSDQARAAFIHSMLASGSEWILQRAGKTLGYSEDDPMDET